MTCAISRLYKLNIQTSAGVPLSTPTLLTAAVISFHTAAFWLPLKPLFRLPDRANLFLWTSDVMVSILSSEKFLFLLDFCISVLSTLAASPLKREYIGAWYSNYDCFQPPHLSTSDYLYAVIDAIWTFHESHVQPGIRWLLLLDLHLFLRCLINEDHCD